MQKLIFTIPFFNIANNAKDLIWSLKEQSNKNFKAILIDDQSTDNSNEVLGELIKNDNRFSIVVNAEKKFALRNIVEQSRKYENDKNIIIGILDGDDALCNSRTVDLFLSAYENGANIAWSKHKWHPGDQNISNSMPDRINPYDYSWVSSHLKTFKSSSLKKIKDDNFKFIDGNFFIRGYDQALFLPLLFVENINRTFIDETCYKYNLDSVSIPLHQRNYNEKEQLRNIRFIRARGFVK